MPRAPGYTHANAHDIKPNHGKYHANHGQRRQRASKGTPHGKQHEHHRETNKGQTETHNGPIMQKPKGSKQQAN